MPSIQIPTIQPEMTEAPLNAPRIQGVQPVDAVTPMAKQSSAIEKAGGDAARLLVELGHQQADVTATDKSNDYLLWRKKRLYGDPDSGWAGYANMEGDPRQLYDQFEKEQRDKLNELSTPGEGQSWSNETQKLVNRRLSRHYTEMELETLTQRSNQIKRYDADTDATAIKINQDGMYGASTFIRPGDPSSFGLVDAKIANIRNTLISTALRNYGATQMNYSGPEDFAANSGPGETPYIDSEGVQRYAKLNPNVQFQIKKAISDGLGSAVTNLIDSNAMPQAKAMKDQYSDFLDGYSKGRLEKQFEKADEDNQSWDLVDQLKGKPLEVQKATLDKLPSKIADKTWERLDAYSRHIDDLKARKQKEELQNIFSKIVDFQKKNPDADPEIVQQQGFWKKGIRDLPPEDVKKLQDSLAPPKISAPGAISNANRILRGEQQVDLTDPGQLLSATSRLGDDPVGSLVRKKLLEAAYPGNAQKNIQYQQSIAALKRQAVIAGLNGLNFDNETQNDFKKGGAQDEAFSKLQTEFTDFFDKNAGLNPTHEQIDKIVKKYVEQKVQTQRDQPSWFSRTFLGTAAKPQAPAASTLTQGQLQGQAIKEWQSQTGLTRQPTPQELRDFRMSTKGKPWSL